MYKISTTKIEVESLLANTQKKKTKHKLTKKNYRYKKSFTHIPPHSDLSNCLISIFRVKYAQSSTLPVELVLHKSKNKAYQTISIQQSNTDIKCRFQQVI